MLLEPMGDGLIRLVDLATGRARRTLRGTIAFMTAYAFSPDGRRLAATSHLGDPTQVWDVTAGGEPATLADAEDVPFDGGGDGIGVARRLAFSRDGRRLAVG